MMHALGFYHEQARFDRDKYIKINFSNIDPKYRSNFNKLRTNTLGLPYDYYSVMHYGRKAFAVDPNKNSITPVDPEVTTLGNGNGFSTIDLKQLNKLYNCGPCTPSLQQEIRECKDCVCKNCAKLKLCTKECTEPDQKNSITCGNWLKWGYCETRKAAQKYYNTTCAQKKICT